MLDNTVEKFYKLTLAAFVAASLVFDLAILWASWHHIAAGYGTFNLLHSAIIS